MCIRFISVRNPGVLFESIRDGHGQLVVVWKGSIIWLLISRLLEGRYHGNQFIGEIGEISDLFLFVVLAFRSGVQYRNFDVNRVCWFVSLLFTLLRRAGYTYALPCISSFLCISYRFRKSTSSFRFRNLYSLL